MFGRFGVTEIIVILSVGFLIFGPKKLPAIGKAFGETINEFKKSAKDLKDDQKEEEQKEIK
jgi:sec-independent protein translocase protein TatA